MAKDPAFLFYPNDWIGGTMGMSFLEKGAYMELLMMQFNRGHMTDDMIGHAVGQIWGQIQHKFLKDDMGLWFNRRLDEEKFKRANYVKSRNNNRLGENQHTKNNSKTKGHTSNHMENENVSVNKDVFQERKDGTEEKKTKKFNHRPTAADFNGLPEMKLGSAVELVSILSGKRITPEKVKRMWEVFKIEILTGEEHYESESKVYRHFTNWLKNQKFKDEHDNKPVTARERQNAATREALDELAETQRLLAERKRNITS